MCMNKVLIDSNILIYAHDSSSPYHEKAYGCIQNLVGQHSACFSMQNYLESYCIWTQKLPKPIFSTDAWKIIEYYLRHPLVQTLFPNEEILEETRKLSITYNKIGVQIFDVQLVATMYVCGISSLYTASTKDFEMFESFTIINPLS